MVNGKQRLGSANLLTFSRRSDTHEDPNVVTTIFYGLPSAI
jgi:hypothetical protein